MAQGKRRTLPLPNGRLNDDDVCDDANDGDDDEDDDNMNNQSYHSQVTYVLLAGPGRE